MVPSPSSTATNSTRQTVDEMFAEHRNTVALEDFIYTALHDENVGYYGSRIPTVGRHGDFSTFATANNDLAKGIANAISQSGLRDVIEVGAGSGALAKKILKSFSVGKRLLSGLRYHIVDTSKPLIEVQRNTLRGAFPASVTWHHSVADALKSINRPAFIFGNELIDAFAPVVLMWRESRQCWAEVCLQRNPENGGIAEVARDIPNPEELLDFPCAEFSALSLSAWLDGKPPYRQRIELHVTFRAWWEEWSALCQPNSKVLWIDYGDTFPQLYVRAPQGTLRAYYRHEHLTGSAVFTRLGQQDITCDVNFTDIRKWGESLGFTVDHDTRQSDWLVGHGVKFSKSANAPAHEAHAAFRVIAFSK